MRTHRSASLFRMIALAIAIFALSTSGLAQTNLNLITHFVDAGPGDDGVSHTVDVYLSVVDEAGSPVTNLQPEYFKVLEDGQKVEIQNVRLLSTEANNVVLVMDISNSMLGTGINDAKLAASTFVSGLKSNDQVAVLTFDDQVIPRVDFTTDHNKVNERIKAINATPQGGTCLYNAALAAVKMFSTVAHGNRAVILFTDGRDETKTGAICSVTTKEEVVAAASEGDLRAPIYTVGMGVEKQIDTETLKLFAERTGGYYLSSPSSAKLSNAFQILSGQLNAQYVLTYRSVSNPGSHKLTVNIGDPERTVPQDTDTRTFSMSVLPAHLSFTRPADGDTIGERLEIAVSLSNQGQAVIERVAFEVNGVGVGIDPETPYEIVLDAKQYAAGTVSISAIAYGESNTELARSSINVVRTESVVPIVPTAIVENTPVQTVPITVPESKSNPVILISILLSVVSVVTIGLLIFYLMRQQKQARAQEAENYEYELEHQTLPSMQRTPVSRRIDENRKASTASIDSEPGVLGALTIQASDDSSLIDHRFEITASLATLGRSADNDINFPNDKAVSRHHAEIYLISGKLYLREVLTTDASGMAQPPKYGTFLNKTQMGSDPALLKTGDEIQLGKRVRLKFESFIRDENAEALTYDGEDLTGADDVDATAMQD